MGLDPSILHSEHIARLLSPAERKKAGVKTSTEAQARYARQQERKMHDEFSAWLNLHRDKLCWDHARMDRKTTNRKGWPDFCVVSHGRVLFVEMKCPGNTLSADQKEVHAWLTAVGCKPAVCFSTQDAIDIVRAAFFI